jgi:hypothetical protein
VVVGVLCAAAAAEWQSVELAEVVTATAIEESWAKHWPAAVEEVVESQARAMAAALSLVSVAHDTEHEKTRTHPHHTHTPRKVRNEHTKTNCVESGPTEEARAFLASSATRRCTSSALLPERGRPRCRRSGFRSTTRMLR